MVLVSRLAGAAGAGRPGGLRGLAAALSLLFALLLGALSRDSVAADPPLDPGDSLPFPGPDAPPFEPEPVCPPPGDPSVVIPDRPPASTTVAAGALSGAFTAAATGEAVYSIPLVVPPGRRGLAPSLSVTYSSAGGDGLLGVGFAVGGLSAITRCPRNLAQDGRIEGVRDDGDDALCLDGRRLVPVGAAGDGKNATLEFRTFPDTFARVIAHFGGEGDLGPDHLVAYARSGLVHEYGTTPSSRVMGAGGVVRSWWLARTSDRRANTIDYTYRSEVDPSDGHTVEHGPLRIDYTGHPLAPASRAVIFDYEDKDGPSRRTLFSRGVRVRNSWRLARARMEGPGGAPVHEVRFGYDKAASPTGRTRLTSVELCDAANACLPKTRFAWSRPAVEPGFDKIPTPIEEPRSNFASPMMLDVTGDGLDDLVIPDAPPEGDSEPNVTHWRVVTNQGPSLGFFPLAATDWLLQPHSPDVALPLVPETGAPLDYDQDGRTDLVLLDVHGNSTKLEVALARPNESLSLQLTAIDRVPTSGLVPSQAAAMTSTHLADVDGDGVSDLVTCTLDPSLQTPVWTARPWRPLGVGTEPGFALSPEPIDPLFGYPCYLRVKMVDADADGKVDLLFQHFADAGGGLVAGTTFDLLSRHSDGTWTTRETELPVPPDGASPLLLDVNGDGLPDAVESFEDGLLRTFLNTGRGFGPAHLSLLGVPQQARHFALATPIDVNADGRQDVLLPLQEADNVSPIWVVLSATGAEGDGTFAVAPSGIDATAQHTEDGIDLADRFAPRVTDVDGDGAQDLLIRRDGRFEVLRNRLGDADLLVGVTDGRNPHDPGEPAHLPTMALRYGHLHDGARTLGEAPGSAAWEAEPYLARTGFPYAPSLPAEHDAIDCLYPRVCVVGPRRVLTGYVLHNGANAPRSYSIAYRDGRYDRHGRGFLGFGARIVRDLDLGASTIELYDSVTFDPERRNYPHAGSLRGTWQISPALPEQPESPFLQASFTSILSEVVPTNDGATYHVLPSLRYQRRWEAWVPPLGVPGKTLEGFVRDVEPEDTRVLAESYLVVDAHDDHGNVTREHAWTDGVDLAVTIERAFSNDEAAWLLGRETYRMECSASAGDEPCRTTTRTYDAAGDVATETIESDDHDPETHLALEVARDAFGNVVLASAHDAYGHHRTTCASYDAEGVFPYAEGNAEAEVHYSWFDPGRGVRTAALDPNGLVTRWDYDGLGRLTREARPDGTETTFTLSRTKDGGPQHDEWTDRLRARTPGGSDDTVQYDALGRPIRWLSQNSPTYVSVGGFVAPKQRRIVREVVYDALGSHIVRRSIPFEEGTPPEDVPQHELTYDAVGRLIAHRTPWNALTRYEHDGHIHRAIDPHDHETATETDALGRPVVVLASEGASTSYSYGPFGLLASVTDAGGEVTTLDRDAYGRVRLRLDPDRGATVTHYDGFGQPRWSIDAADRVVSYGFDRVGRRIRRTDVDGTATWTWGSSVPAIGLLTKATSADGATTELKYDVSGRPTSASLTLDGETFATGATYDAQGRLDTLTYQAPGVEPLVVQRDYDPYGRLRSVRDGSTGDPYWHELDTDGAGRTAGELFGNGVTTARTYHDAKDRVESITTLAPAGVVQSLTYDYGRKRSPTRRADGLLGKVELFEHDALDRLTCSRFEDEKADCALAYAYAPNGNVTYKSDVGDYTYDPEHPHAALTAGSESFGYDEVGNQVVRPGAKITYSALDLPKRYDLDAGGTVTFDYDADGQRVRKASELAETITLGGLYERVTHYDTGVVDHRFFVRSSERVVAVVQRSLGGRSGAFYLHPDALGSIEVVTDANGTVEERRSYDAFGTRRDPSWGPAPFGPPPSSVVRSGFTGHDDDELGLVDMKGRIYDPRIARFLTTDPFVSRPLFSQAWNRYSYVENAPLSFTDPTGFQAADTTEVRWWYELPEGASSGEGVLSGPPPPEDWSAELAYDGARSAPTDAGIQGDRGADVPAGAARPEATMSLPAPLATAWEVQLGVQDATAEFARHAVMQAVVDAPSFGANNTSTLILSLVTTEPDSLPGVVGMLNPALKLTLDPLVAMGDRLEKAAAAAEQGDARGTGREATAAVLLGGVTLLGAAEGIGPLAAEARGATGAARAADGLIDPNLVRFSQDSVKSTFRNGAGVNDAIAALRGPDGASVAARFPPIRLFESEGRLFTLDNRRLLAFSMAGREVPFRMATAAEISQEGTRKLSTTAAQGWGWTITVRP